MKKAFITGVSGQDGSYLSELLLSKGYEVHGLIRRSSSFNTSRINHLIKDVHEESNRFFIHHGDLADGSNLRKLLHDIMPNEIYNLAAQSHVRVSFDIPEFTADVTGVGVLRLLEAYRDVVPQAKFYQASSSEMYGLVQEVPQTEKTPFYPRSPYACSKAFAHYMTVNYRESYNLFACAGILMNHESPRRGETFVTRKICIAAARIAKGLQKELYLGNLDSKRDWGYAPEYVEAMWRMLQQDQPEEFVIATGETHTVKEFAELAFDCVGLNAYDYIKIDPRYYRPTEVDLLIGDATKAKEKLGWEPKVSFKELVSIMMHAEMHALE